MPCPSPRFLEKVIKPLSFSETWTWSFAEASGLLSWALQEQANQRCSTFLGRLRSPPAGKSFTAGRTCFFGERRNSLQFRNRQIGFVFQFHYLLPEFNALENVMMPGIIAGLSQREVKAQALSLLEQIGTDRPASTSRGRTFRWGAAARGCGSRLGFAAEDFSGRRTERKPGQQDRTNTP